MIESNAAAKKATLERHKAAFGLWLFIHKELEDVVICDRNPNTAFARAIDLLFIQAFKSHGSLYSLCVIGHCEDAATIARRIFEVALQIRLFRFGRTGTGKPRKGVPRILLSSCS